MGNRYIVSGAQLGELITLCKIDPTGANERLNKIIENQCIGESVVSVAEDVAKLQSEWS